MKSGRFDQHHKFYAYYWSIKDGVSLWEAFISSKTLGSLHTMTDSIVLIHYAHFETSIIYRRIIEKEHLTSSCFSIIYTFIIIWQKECKTIIAPMLNYIKAISLILPI
jgi:hypothetical protein